MTTARVSTSSLNQGPSKKRSVLAGNLPILSGGYESIATATGTGSSGTITFSSIPSTYKHLQVRYIARGDTATVIDWVFFRLNGDTGSNYAAHELYGNGASAVAGAATGQTSGEIGVITEGGSSASIFGVGVIDILDYTSTNKAKTVRSLWGFDSNGSGRAGMVSSLYFATPAAVTSLTLFINSANFVSGSHFALYGIR